MPLGRYAGLLPILQHLRYITNFPEPISYFRHPRNQSPSGAQQSPAATSSLPESVTQNSASSTPPTITINGDNPAIITVGDSYADLGATMSDIGTGQAGDTNLGYKTFLNGALVSNIVIDKPGRHRHIDYVATDNAWLTATPMEVIIALGILLAFFGRRDLGRQRLQPKRQMNSSVG